MKAKKADPYAAGTVYTEPFVARPYGKRWGVYDRNMGSWPLSRPGLGKIAQDTDRQTAEAEAERLNSATAAHPA